MSRSYRHRVTLTTLTIDVVFFTVVTPFKLAKRVNRWRRTHNPKIVAIDSMSGLEFEKFVAHLLKQQGYKHIRLTERYDFGIDIIAVKDSIRWGVQVKRHKGLVKAIAVRQVVTALRKYDCDRAMVISNNSYSNVAKELAKSNACVLVDRTKLYRWVNSA